MTDSAGSVIGETVAGPTEAEPAEMDHFGANAGLSAPLYSIAPPDEGGGSYPNIGSMSEMFGGCRADGMPIPCEMVSAENSVECLNGDCGAHSITVLGRSNGQVVSSSTVLVRQGQAGWDGSLDGTYRIIGHGSLSLGALGNVSGLLNALSGLDGHGIGEYGGAAFQRVSGVAGSSGLFFDHPQQTAPQVGGTNDKGKIKVFTNAFNKAVSLLDNEACAKLFGGKDAALKALYGASYSYRDLGVPIYNPDTQTVKVTGAATLSNTNPPSVYLNTNGPFSNTTLLVMTPSGVQSKTVDFKTGMRGAEFGALLLLHELGHLVGIFKADASNAELNRQYTQQVQDACFKKE